MAHKGETQAAENEAKQGKGRPTPKRRVAEAANARPIVGSRDKETQKLQRQHMREARERARLGMMAGEERYLTVRDRGPQRRFVRDYVDNRWSLGELIIPLMFVVLLITFIPGQIQVYSIIFIWGWVLLSVLDNVWMCIGLKKALTAKFGSELQGGWRWYASMRAWQLRPLRLPKPQVKRGELKKRAQ